MAHAGEELALGEVGRLRLPDGLPCPLALRDIQRDPENADHAPRGIAQGLDVVLIRPRAPPEVVGD